MRILMSSVLCALCLPAIAAPTLAQVAAPAPGAVAPERRVVRAVVPQRETLTRLMRQISVDFQEKRLQDVIAFVKDFTGADIEPLWLDDRNTDGLDPERLISVSVSNVTGLALIERILEQARGDFGDNGWQMSESGAIQIGPKSRLNKSRRVEIYSISDLITDIPNYTDVPQIDLQQALQASQQGGGGGGQGPFQQDQEDQTIQRREKIERANEVMDLLKTLVESEQWVDNGGEGGTMRYWQGSLIVNAPDYMHRGLNGYPYWPAEATQSRVVEGRRYVTLNGDAGIAKVSGFAQQPVSAVVGGKPVSSNPGGGGR